MPRGLPGRWMDGFEFDWYISPDPQKIQIFALKIDTKFVFFLTKSENTFSSLFAPRREGGRHTKKYFNETSKGGQ